MMKQEWRTRKYLIYSTINNNADGTSALFYY